MKCTAFLTLAAAGLLAPALSAQQLVGLDGVTGEILVFHGTGAGCPTLSPPVQEVHPTQVTGTVCVPPATIGAPGTTDVGAVAALLRSGRYRYAMAPNVIDLNNYGGMHADGTFEGASDMLIWGLGDITGAAYRYDAATDTESVYLTAGQSILKFNSTVACTGTPFFSFGEAWPFHSGPGLMTGLDYVETDGTMWACTSAGQVMQLTATGTVATSFPASLLQPHLTGIAVDSVTGTVYVTDGLAIMGYDASGNPAGGDIWWPSVFEFAPGGLVGLDWVPTGTTYGAGLDLGGGPAPTLTAGGYSVLGNPFFSLDVQGTPGATYVTYWGPSELCPSLSVLGLPLHIAPPFSSLGGAVADASGLASKPAPMPSSAAFVGARIHAQAIGIPATGILQITDAVTFVISTH